MNVNFELFKVFYEVAKEKSISKGANNLMISQPAVSQSIQTLENQLGGKLFIRTRKGVILTEEGKELYNYIKEGIYYFINGTNKFNSLKNLDSGSINIGASTIISENYLMSYLKEFHNKYPSIQINIKNDLTDNLIKDLRNGNLDLIIFSIPDHIIKDLKIIELDELNDIFVCSKDYKIDTNNIKDILSNNLILQKYPSITRINFNKFLKDNNLECTPSMEVVSHNLLTRLVEDNFGVGVLTKEFIQDKLNNTLIEIKTDKKIPKRKLGLAIKDDIYPSFTTQKFIELLTNKMSQNYK
ncbi:MAG: LysR family transcriptional regulator [Bacilli bacterium]|nr:LysR family transcriptional regulator [Bacilli bacterium]